jgi:hypothetical protein
MSEVKLDRDNLLIAGERLADLRPVLGQLGRATVDDDDGTLRFNMNLPRRLGTVVTRALMRIEAELLVADAARLRPNNIEDLDTPSQRRSVAFAELVRRLLDATT